MKYRFLSQTSALLAASIFLTSCGAPTVEENAPENPAKTISAEEIIFQEIAPTVSVSGTLKPAIESVVAAESGGTVANIFANEGDAVEIGSPLLSFSIGDNLAASDLSAANISFQNAERSLQLAREKAAKDAEISVLSIQNAEKNLESARKSDSSTSISLDSQKASAESSVNLAKISLQNAERNLADLKANLDLSEKNLAENAENTKATAFANFRPAMTAMDEILGVSEERRNDNALPRTLLGFKDPETYQIASNTLRGIWNAFVDLDSKFSENTENVSLDETLAFGEEIRFALQKTDEMLQKTISGTGLSETTLSGLRTNITARRSALEAQIAQITATNQAISDFEIKKPQNLTSAEVAVQSAKEQLTQAEKGLTQTESGGNVSRVGTETAIVNAKNALATTKIQAEITEKQNEMAIQSASAARDAASSALTSAQIRYGKLSTSSPIAGVVTEKSVDLGDTVNAGSPLFIIAQINPLKLTADVPVDILTSIALGDPARVSVDVFGEKMGKITKIFPVADAATRRVNIEISLENPAGKIPANIFATASIDLPVKENAILIPRSALISQNPPTVFVISEGKVEKRQLELGSDSGTKIEILKGLSVGEIIVPEPILGLVEGDAVEFDLSQDSTPEAAQETEKPAETPEENPSASEDTAVQISETPSAPENAEEESIRPAAETKNLLETPLDGEHFSESPIAFRGIAPEGTASVSINNYSLSSFSSSDLSFQYFADPFYKNLKSGENTYIIAAFDAEGNQIDAQTITLFFD